MALMYPEFYKHLKMYRNTRSLNRFVWRSGRKEFRPFTGNAILVQDKDGTVRLFSYVTEMCHVKPDGTFIKTSNAYSTSTWRHLKMFAEEFAPEWLASIRTKPNGKTYKTFKEAWLAFPKGSVSD